MQQSVLVTSLILSGLCLAACSNRQTGATTSSPHCGDAPYSVEKADAQTVRLPSTPLSLPDGYGPDGILTMDHPLGVPPEIARIRRGLTFHSVGGFINDGLENWYAVDLDAKTVVSIERRFFSAGAKLSRAFGDPVFRVGTINTAPPSVYAPSLYARKWSDSQRKSEEVIAISAIQSDAEEAFVCTANPIWAAPPERKPRQMPTDTLINEASLLDFDQSAQKQYMKDVPSGSALKWVTNNLPVHVKYEWPLSERR